MKKTQTQVIDKDWRNTPHIGERCPLCKKGLIVYVRFGTGWMREYEYVCCSNEDCMGNIEIL